MSGVDLPTDMSKVEVGVEGRVGGHSESSKFETAAATAAATAGAQLQVYYIEKGRERIRKTLGQVPPVQVDQILSSAHGPHKYSKQEEQITIGEGCISTTTKTLFTMTTSLNDNNQLNQNHSHSSCVDSSSSTSPCKTLILESKRAKRVRRNYHKRASRSQLHLRRMVQAAPNNNNEFLMKEHDSYHFDHQHSGSAEDEDVNRDIFYSQGGASSSPDDEEEFLTRDFSNAYDVEHAERLNSMSKHELIQEYQLLEERVETLERKIRTRHSLQQIQTPGSEGASPYHSASTVIRPGCGSECISLKSLEEELGDLREENRKLKQENKMLGTLSQIATDAGSEEIENDTE